MKKKKQSMQLPSIFGNGVDIGTQHEEGLSYPSFFFRAKALQKCTLFLVFLSENSENLVLH